MVDLKCAAHYLCKDCLQLKTKEEGWHEMYVCRSCPLAERSVPSTHVFVDWANLWIEAKKKTKTKFDPKCKEDHRIRINHKELRLFLEELESPLEDIKLYDTDHLPDETWPGFVKTLVEKSGRKQKKVDTTIVRDILRLLRTVPYSKRSTVIIVSGDADMLPALEDISEENWKVKICSWDHCRARDLHEFQRERSNVSIVSLDEHWDRLVYRETEVTSDDEADYRNFGLVLTLLPNGRFLTDEKIEHTRPRWWNEIEAISRWPFQYKWLTDEAKYLLLVFKNMEKVRGLGPKLKNMQHISHCDTYPTYVEKQKRGPAKRATEGTKYSDVTRQK